MGAQLASSDDPAGVMEVIARLTVDRLPQAEWASITTLRAGEFVTVAATDDRARAGDRIQYEVGSGPCIDALLDDAIYHPSDIAHDARWPQFGRRVAAELGVRSMLSYRLTLGVDDVIASMNVYSRTPDAFAADAVTIGLLLAVHGAVAVTAATTREEASNLRRALENSREIGVAMGVLMNTHSLTRTQAFDLLRIASQRSNHKLHDIATRVADTGTIDVGLGS
jgi:hypothetical protein